MKHAWNFSGGGDWMVYTCNLCKHSEIAGAFGFMWSDLLRHISRKRECPGPSKVYVNSIN